jgi:hypothetical protein
MRVLTYSVDIRVEALRVTDPFSVARWTGIWAKQKDGSI